MGFKYVAFTKKQLQLLTWWTPKCKWKNANGVIAEGAVRAGKTIIMGLSFIIWSMQNTDSGNYALCGKTVQATRRNLIEPLIGMLRMRGYKVVDRKSNNTLIIAKDEHINTYYVFGGKDEGSAQLIQGITLSGVLFDEVALMPQSFVNQAIARCSVKGSKYWFNCNPEGPRHWFKLEHVEKAKEKKYLRLHFNLEDNPSMDEETREKYYSMFTGLFYKRFILGEWAFADGVVYSNIPEKTYYTNATRSVELPIACQERDVVPFYACDYGTANPCVFLEMYRYKMPGDSIPHYYIDREYYWDSRKKFKQKEDSEYTKDMLVFINNERYKYVIVDPSATSFIASLRGAKVKVIKAKNDVMPGISMVSTLFTTGHIHINKDNCKMLCSELGSYIWDEKKAQRGVEDVVKANDHACDALKYGIFTTAAEYEVYNVKLSK